MRSRRHIPFVLLSLLALVASACGGDDADTPSDTASASDATTTTAKKVGPGVSITSPRDGTVIKGNVVTLNLAVGGIKVVKADGDVSGATGHFHVFVDKEPPAVGALIDKGPGIIHSADNPVLVPGLSKGDHTLTIVLGDGTHKRIDAKAVAVKIKIAGPSLKATAPTTLAAGAPLSIDVTVDGVRLTTADGDTSGATGHLHAFVDKPPVLPGELIPTGDPAIIHSATSPISVTGLAAGEHTIWIVLGDGAHAAFTDSVRDKVTVLVS